MFLNAQSVRNKALDICDYIMQANVDLVFPCETLLRPVGDEVGDSVFSHEKDNTHNVPHAAVR